MALAEFFPEWSCIFTIAVIAILIITIAMCVCSKNKEKTQEYGTAGRLSITRDSPLVQLRSCNGGSIAVLSPDSETPLEDGVKRNSWTVKDRALPDIPNSQIAIMDGIDTLTASEDQESCVIEINNTKRRNYNKAAAPKPPINDPVIDVPLNGMPSSIPSQSSALRDPPHLTVTITVNDYPQASDTVNVPGFGSSSLANSSENLPGTSNVILRKIGKVDKIYESELEISCSDAEKYDMVSDTCNDPTLPSPSPVCIRIGGSPDLSETETPAGLAVAGSVPSSDIPYMTPPILHNAPETVISEVLQENNTIGSRSEVPYTVISVREPLARVREITLRKQRSAAQQNSEESEDHYAMVPEEEQMYAEIGSGQDSASSSVTYAHIEPRDLPPVPPTVESLKSVAHAHSRQASTVSTSSFASGISSSGEPTSPPTLRNPSTSSYSTVEKTAKQRKTIHVAEGASLITTAEKRKKVEDLYAKVHKKRTELTISTSGAEDYAIYQGLSNTDEKCGTPPPSPWASTTPPAPPPITGRLQAASLGVLSSTSSQSINKRHSADPCLIEYSSDSEVLENLHVPYLVRSKESDEPGYERIYNKQSDEDGVVESCYEKIKECENDEGCQSEPKYEQVEHQENVENDSNYPGYEVFDDEEEEFHSDPCYECVARLGCEGDVTDPGYEPVRISANLDDNNLGHSYDSMPFYDDKEPGYETVKRLHRTESDVADPGYERICKLLRAESDATEPGYERVRNKIDDTNDPGYETVHRSDSDAEPGYEIVRHTALAGVVSPLGACGGIDHSLDEYAETYQNSNNSTVLFVSGNSYSNIEKVEAHNEVMKCNIKSFDERDSNATFL